MDTYKENSNGISNSTNDDDHDHDHQQRCNSMMIINSKDLGRLVGHSRGTD